MVTVKRKINNETERYGGFSEVEIKPPQHQVDVKVGDSFREAQVKRAETSEAPQVVRDKREQIYSKPTTPTSDEFMPTIRTTADGENTKIDTRAYSSKKQAQNIDSRTKLILGVYIAIILLLSAVVIATGIILSSSGARVEALESELAARSAVVNAQSEDIARLSDRDNIAGRALNNGMEKYETSESIDLLPMGEPQTYEGITNWFDSFCDWVSGVIGG